MDSKSGPIGFWFINGRFDESIIDEQLKEFLERGFAGVVVHPRAGLEIPYLSARWFELLGYIVDQCIELGLEPWFYDEDPFPSGSAGGFVLDKHPELVCKGLDFTSLQTTPQSGVINVSFSNIEELIGIFSLSMNKEGSFGGQFEDITKFAGRVGKKWQVAGLQDSPYGPIFSKGKCQPHWRATVRGGMWALHWQVNDDRPRHILAVSKIKRADNRHGYYVDLLNPETTKQFIKYTHQKTLETIGSERFGQFVAAFTDEPKLCAPYPWTDRFPLEYEKKYGQDVLKLLPHLAYEIDSNSRLVRYRYRRLLGELWKNNFIVPLSKWCKNNNIALTGHISPEEDPVLESLATPGRVSLISEMDWPGCDQISSLFGAPEHGYLSLGPKLTTSLAHQKGKPHSMAETLAVSGENLTIQRMKKIIDWLGVCGIDKFVLHGQFMSLQGHRKREAPPSIFYQAPYWKYFQKLSSYMSSLSKWNQSGKPVRPIALLYPTAAFEVFSPVQGNETMETARSFGQLIGSLMSAGLGFDIVADIDLADMLINQNGEKGFKICHASYKSLIVPNVAMLDKSTHEALDAIEKSGNDICSLVEDIEIIENSDSSRSYGKYFNNIESLMGNLIGRYRQWIGFSKDSSIYVQSRKIKKNIEHLVYNPTDNLVSLNVDNAASVYTFESAAEISLEVIADKDKTVKLLPWQTIIVSDKSNSCQCNAITTLDLKSNVETAWSSNWQLSPDEPNSMLLSTWQFTLADGSAGVAKVPSVGGPLWEFHRQRVGVWCDVIIDDDIEDLQLWWEKTAFAGPYEIKINGFAISKVEDVFVHNIHYAYCSINEIIKTGVNRIEINVGPVEVDNPAILDAPRLVGRFRVIRTQDCTSDKVPDCRPDWYKTMIDDDQKFARITSCFETITLEKPLDWAKLGFPHYSGAMSYETSLDIVNIPKACYVEAVSNQQDSFEMFVNGKSAGICCWQPFRLEITKLLKAGSNNIEFKVANTLINKIEGLDQPSGLLDLPKIMVKA